MIFCEYQVTGKRNYRGHEPGTIFEARHDPAKQRAINRGDITLLRIHEPEVPPDYTYPDGWEPPPERAAPTTTRGAERRLSSSKGG